MSLKDTILSADDLGYIEVHVPEWDVTVGVRGMDGAEQIRMQKAAAGRDDHFYADLCVALVVDPETRQPVFEPADRDALMHKSGAALERIGQAVLAMSQISDDEAEAVLEADPT